MDKLKKQDLSLKQAFQESEERYRNLFNSLIEGFCVIEMIFDEQGKPVDYRFLEINPVFEAQTGLPNAQGKLMRDLAPDHEAYWFEIYGKVALTGEPARFENEAKALNRWFNVAAFRVGGPDSRKVAICFNDISKRKKAEQKLRESEERFKVIASSTPDHILVQDRDLRYTFVINPQMGLTEKDMIGKTDFDFLKKEDAENLTRIKRQVLDTGKGIHLEIPLTEPGGDSQIFSGDYVPKYDAAGKVDGLIGYFRNITESKRTEEALRLSEERLETIFSTSPTGIFITRLSDGKFIKVNEAYLRLIGYPAGEIIGQTSIGLNIFVDPEDRKRIVDLIVDQGRVYAFDVKFRRKTGEIINVLVSALPLNQEGEQYLLGTLTDITDRKRAEEILKRDKDTFEKLVKERTIELVETQVELEKAKRLSDIGVLAATVAHELRNPLAAINLAAHNIERKAGAPEIEKNLANIHKKVIEGDQIINNLLFYSRLRLPHYENIKIAEIIEEFAEACEKHSKKGIIVTTDLKPISDVMIAADPLQLREVFNNLLNNAQDAVQPEKGRISVLAKNEKDFIKLSIEDNGTGIERDDLVKIFDPFFSTKTKGTGLGLSISKHIIDMHGGEILVESEAGKGTIINVRLPKNKENGF